MTLADLAAWIARSGASVHVSWRGGRFLVVAHADAHARGVDLTDPDLEAGLARATAALDEQGVGAPPSPRAKPLRKRTEVKP